MKNKEGKALEANTTTDDEDFPDLDRGWAWMVMFASFGSFFLQGGAMYASGIVHSALLDKYGAPVSLTSWAGGLYVSLCSLAGPVATAVIDRYSCRTAMMLSGTLCMLGFFSTAFAPNIHVAIFTCGFVAGLGNGLGYTTSMVVVGFNFRKRRSLALGFSVSGVGAGLFALAPVMQFARNYYGDFGFFIVFSGLMFNIALFGVICFPSQLEKHTQEQRKLQALKQTYTSRIGRYKSALKPYLKVLLNKGIFCLCLAMFGYCLGTYLIYLHLPKYIVLQGFSPEKAATFISLSGILSVIGRFLTGVISNWERMHSMISYAGSMFLVAVAAFVYPFVSQHEPGQIVFAVILGLFFGSCYVVTTNVSLKFVDINFLSAAIGLEFMFGGLGALIGPVFAGFLVDNGGSYDQSILVAAFCIFLSSIVGAFSLCFQRSPDVMVVEVTEPLEKELAKLNGHKRAI